MISPEEFVARCKRQAELRQEHTEKLQAGKRELVALCSLTEHTLRQSYPNVGQVEITDPEGEVIFAGPIEEALFQLVYPA